MAEKKKGAAGRPEFRVKIVGDWQDAMREVLRKPPPAASKTKKRKRK